MRNAERNLTIFVMLFILSFLGLGVFRYEYEWMVLRFPLLVGLVACLLCVGNLAKGARGAQAARGANKLAKGDTTHDPLTFRQALPAMIWVAAVVPVVFLLGYVIGLPLYVFVYLKAHEQGWITSGALSLATLGVVYLGFVKILAVPLPVFPVGLG